MTEISSDTLVINKKAENVFNFLADLRNYKNLMPDDVGEFSATEEDADLNLKGLGKFHIKLTEKEAYKRLKLTPSGKLPFKFHIEWVIADNGDSSTVTGHINAELNMFMKMMAEPKLRSFVDKQAHKLKDFLETEITS